MSVFNTRIGFFIAWASCFLLGLSACSSDIATEEKEDSKGYLLPIFRKADSLRTINPDSAILLCNNLLRLKVDNKISDSMDTEVRILKALTVFSKGNQDDAINFLKECLSERKDPFAVIRFNYQLADFYLDETRLEEALYHVNIAIKENHHGKYAMQLASCYNLQGLVFSAQGNFKQAEICLNKSLKIWENLKDLKEYANVLQNVGNLYADLKDSTTAILCYSRCARIYESLQFETGLSAVYNNLGIMYRRKDPDSAMYYYNKVTLPKVDKEGARSYVVALFNKGNIYFDRGKYDSAVSNYNQVLDICKQHKLLQGYPMVYSSLGNVAARKGDYKQAILYMTEAIAWCDSLGLMAIKLTFLNDNVEFLKKNNQFEEALQVQTLAMLLQDSIKTNEAQEALKKNQKINRDKVDLMQKLELEKQHVRSKTIRMRIAQGIAFIITMIGIIVIYKQRHKQKNKL